MSGAPVAHLLGPLLAVNGQVAKYQCAGMKVHKVSPGARKIKEPKRHQCAAPTMWGVVHHDDA